MFGHSGGNRGKHLEKILELFSHMPDKGAPGANIAGEDKPDLDGEAGKVDLGLGNAPQAGHQLGALPGHGFPQKKPGFK